MIYQNLKRPSVQPFKPKNAERSTRQGRSSLRKLVRIKVWGGQVCATQNSFE